jgi:endonuclease-3
VARRIGLAAPNADPEKVRRTIMDAAPSDWSADRFFDLHWLLKRLGQSLCQDSHTRCGACPVAALCAERQSQGPQSVRRAGNVTPVRFWNKQ